MTKKEALEIVLANHKGMLFETLGVVKHYPLASMDYENINKLKEQAKKRLLIGIK